MRYDEIEIKIEDINKKIRKEQDNKNIGIVLIIVSLFCLWPLMIVGIILIVNANKKIGNLENEKMELLLSQTKGESYEKNY